MPVKKNKILVTILAITLFLIIQIPDNSYGTSEIVFITNPSVDTNALSKSEIKKIFLGEKITWENGDGIIITILMEPTLHKIFTTQYLKRSSIQFIRYWRNRVFNGKSSMPHMVKTETEMISFVSKTKGAIGYIPSGTPAKGTKIIEIKEP